MASFGCAEHKATKKPTTAPKSAVGPPQLVNIVDGSATFFGTHNELLWKLRWKTGQVSFTPNSSKSDSNGALNGVSGEIFQSDRISSTFASNHGNGNKTTNILTLTDHVIVTSKDPGETMECDHLIYDGNTKIIKASGNVRVTGTWSTVGTIDEIWTTPALSEFATPDMFEQP